MKAIRPYRQTGGNEHRSRRRGTSTVALSLSRRDGSNIRTWVLGTVAGIAAAIVVLLAQFAGTGSGFLALSVLHLAFGLSVFALLGGALMTPTGLWYLSTAVFVGGAGLYVVSLGAVDPYSAYVASLAVFLGNLLLYALRFRQGGWAIDPGRSDAPVSISSSRSSWHLGVALLGLALVINVAGLEALRPIPYALAFSGVVALFASVALSVAAHKRSVLVVAVVASFGFALYIEVFFSGFGRLNIVGLLLAGGLVVNILRPRMWHKRLLLVLIIPAWIVAGIVGTQRGPVPRETSVQGVVSEGEGLGSGYGGMLRFAELVQLDREKPQEAFPRQYGLTLVEAFTAPFPRAWWAEKPVGFGSSLAWLFLPSAAARGHSEVATSFGEWYVNFWWFGFALMPFVFAPVLRLADAWQGRRKLKGVASTADLFSLLVLVIVMSSIPNYIWGSLFSVIARAGIRVLLLAPLWVGALWLESTRRRVVTARRA